MPELQVLKTQICPRVSILTLRYKFSCYQASVILINTMKHALLICLFAGTFKIYSYAANTWQLTLAHSKETLNIICVDHLETIHLSFPVNHQTRNHWWMILRKNSFSKKIFCSIPIIALYPAILLKDEDTPLPS